MKLGSKLKILKVVKISPAMVLSLLKYNLSTKPVTCTYCPGICITECPTYVSTGNTLLSPLGYARFPEKTREYCLRCWRCSQICPLHTPVPSIILPYAKKTYIEVLEKGGDEPFLVGDEEDIELIKSFARKVGLGYIIVKGIRDFYRFKSSRNKYCRIWRKLLKNKCVAFSPEVAFVLDMPFIVEELDKLGLIVKGSLKLHIPCLLVERGGSIIKKLEEKGVRIVSVNSAECLGGPLGNVYHEPNLDSSYVSLCPRAREYGLKLIYDFISLR